MLQTLPALSSSTSDHASSSTSSPSSSSTCLRSVGFGCCFSTKSVFLGFGLALSQSFNLCFDAFASNRSACHVSTASLYFSANTVFLSHLPFSCSSHSANSSSCFARSSAQASFSCCFSSSAASCSSITCINISEVRSRGKPFPLILPPFFFFFAVFSSFAPS